MPYLIIRYYQDVEKLSEIVMTVATLSEAREHCDNPESSSQGVGAEARKRYREYGSWFDGFTEVKT